MSVSGETALFLVGALVVLIGIVVLFFLPQRAGGTVEAFALKASAPGAGLLLIVLGLGTMAFAARGARVDELMRQSEQNQIVIAATVIAIPTPVSAPLPTSIAAPSAVPTTTSQCATRVPPALLAERFETRDLPCWLRTPSYGPESFSTFIEAGQLVIRTLAPYSRTARTEVPFDFQDVRLRVSARVADPASTRLMLGCRQMTNPASQVAYFRLNLDFVAKKASIQQWDGTTLTNLADNDDAAALSELRPRELNTYELTCAAGYLNASLNGRALFAHDIGAIGESPTIGQAWIGFQANGAAEVRFDDLEIVGR